MGQPLPGDVGDDDGEKWWLALLIVAEIID